MTMYCLALYFFVSACFIGSSLQSDDDDDGRIVGGEPAHIEDLPYQLSVRDRHGHFCGASIIGAYWAISAAHCFTDNPKNVILVSGTSLKSNGGSKHRVEKVISHPLYDNFTVDYDIAVLQVREPFHLGSPGVNCIRLATKNVLPGTLALVSGWGYTTEGGKSPDQLRKVYVPIISRRKCNKLYGYHNITENMICAGYMQGGKGVCHEDSGGPLVADNQLIGIVSWGAGCAEPGFPQVYTNVNNLLKWVLSITGNLNC